MRLAGLVFAAVVTAACATSAGHGTGPAAGAVPGQEAGAELAASAASWKGRCDRGFAVDCRKLGRAELNGEGVPHDDRLAAAHLMKGCEIGEPASCSDLAVLTLLGRGVAQDDAVGGALTRRACDAGYALACSNLGTLTVEGVNRLTLRPDEEGQGGAKIMRYFQTACDAGAPEGCLNLGTARERGDLVNRDLPGAGKAFRLGCQGGLALACYRLALLAIEAPAAVPDADVATLTLEACRAGISAACTQPGAPIGQVGPRTPSPRLVTERYSFALGIPGAGGFNPLDLARPAGGPRRSRAELRRLPADQLARLPPALRQRVSQEWPAVGEVKADEAVELLLRLRRPQLATCLERERSSPAAAELAAIFLLEASGKPGELHCATEPADQGLDACAAEVIGGWTFPTPVGGVGGPHLVSFGFEAAPPGPSPEFASGSGLRPSLKEPGCVERSVRVPEAYRGAENAVTVKLVVDRAGKPALFHALTPAAEALVAAIGEAVRACEFRAGTGEDGQPRSIWMTMTVRLDGR
jgi:TPR repeat protein